MRPSVLELPAGAKLSGWTNNVRRRRLRSMFGQGVQQNSRVARARSANESLMRMNDGVFFLSVGIRFSAAYFGRLAKTGKSGIRQGDAAGEDK